MVGARDQDAVIEFNGGQARIYLIDEDDPLESGIEIVAQPPGTKLRGITLLSGGQKTMTAVALLFAIYMVKPSPLCVLDELDAPLDDANVNRFTDIIREFTRFSQFVVITHNKRTMSRADVIYGVTMQEFGVSKPVGVRMTSEEKKPSKMEELRTVAIIATKRKIADFSVCRRICRLAQFQQLYLKSEL